jgi:PLP dependent protein
MTVQDNLRVVRSRIENAAKKAGKSASDITLVAATKGVPVELMIEAIKAGLTDIGENRVQEALSKHEALKSYPVKWHMIGHLQTNKVKQAVQIFDTIQSVDSERLAKEISIRVTGPKEVFIEVNTSGEASKSGIEPEKAIALATYISSLVNLKLTGLMTIGPLSDDENDTRNAFRSLKTLFEQIKALNLPGFNLKYLSMGMSQDFETAIEEGSDLVRVGRAIFGIDHKRTA